MTKSEQLEDRVESCRQLGQHSASSDLKTSDAMLRSAGAEAAPEGVCPTHSQNKEHAMTVGVEIGIWKYQVKQKTSRLASGDLAQLSSDEEAREGFEVASAGFELPPAATCRSWIGWPSTLVVFC